MKAYEPLERLGIYGQGVTGLMGGYPAQYQFTQQPNASPLAQALGGVGAIIRWLVWEEIRKLMNRTLRRPMFRMGGSTGEGITSGLTSS